MGMTERKEKEKLIRRNDIINAAEKVFFEKDFEHATMDDIAKEVEYTKKTLYSYFKSKEELYYEIMLRGYNTINAMCDEKLNEICSKPESEKIRAIGIVFINFRHQYPGYFKAIMDYENREDDFQKNNESAIIAQCYEEGQHSFNIIKECVIKGIENGEFSNKIDPVTTVFTLWSYLMGIVSLINKKERYINNYYNKTISEIVEGSFEIIINSIKNV